MWRGATRGVKVRARIVYKSLGYYTLSGTPRSFVDLYTGTMTGQIRCYVNGDENKELLSIIKWDAVVDIGNLEARGRGKRRRLQTSATRPVRVEEVTPEAAASFPSPNTEIGCVSFTHLPRLEGGGR
eukprot:6181458-Prorocentrum_lima.AAC.1